MHLVIFDIDGTLIDSVKTDFTCFIQAFKLVFNLDLSDEDWSQYRDLTDSGLTRDIFEKHYKRLPSRKESEALQAAFVFLLTNELNQTPAIPGAVDLVRYLDNLQTFEVAFATGGWRKSASIKLQAIGVSDDRHVMTTAEDCTSKQGIIKLAVEKCNRSSSKTFGPVTYVGDHPNDFRSATNLGIPFLGIDHHRTHDLSRTRADYILNDFLDLVNVFRILQRII